MRITLFLSMLLVFSLTARAEEAKPKAASEAKAVPATKSKEAAADDVDVKEIKADETKKDEAKKEPKPWDKLIEAARKVVKEISPDELEAMQKADKALYLLDVRTKAEYDLVHIAGAHLIPRGMLEFKIGNNNLFPKINKNETPKKDQTIVVYCKNGLRSLLAAKTLIEMGYTKVFELKGGSQAWRDSGRSLMSDLNLSTDEFIKRVEAYYGEDKTPDRGNYDDVPDCSGVRRGTKKRRK